MLNEVQLKINDITTDDLRKYLADYKNNTDASKTTIIFEEFFQAFLAGLRMRIIF